MDGAELRSLVGRRVLVQYASGSQLVGKVSACRPDLGAVHLVELAEVSLISREGAVLAELPTYPFIPSSPSSVTPLGG